MPTVGRVSGVKIQLFADDHPPPHFHAVLPDASARVEIGTGRVLNSTLPRAKLAHVLAWAERREPELRRAWEALRNLRKPDKIE